MFMSIKESLSLSLCLCVCFLRFCALLEDEQGLGLGEFDGHICDLTLSMFLSEFCMCLVFFWFSIGWF